MADSGVIITGVAGFIGSALAHAHLADGVPVLGLDVLADADPALALRRDRLARLQGLSGFSFERLDLSDARAALAAFERAPGATVLHLAAQAGVRHPRPRDLLTHNVDASFNVLEASVAIGAPHLVFASSSSVYGASAEPPFQPRARTDRPRSLYAATKVAGEALAAAYAQQFGLPCTAVRFFNVYGPWGRPDMAPHLFTRSILDGRPIELFDGGRARRDFTYIDDAVRCVLALERRPPSGEGSPYRVYNVGSGRAVEMAHFVHLLERRLGREAITHPGPAVPADMPATLADVEELERAIGFRPSTPLERGLDRFVSWFLDYYRA